jgi:glycine cleavage system transcriptional repressor
VTTVLAARDANIGDLTTRVIGTPDDPVYVMLLQITLPPGVAAEELRAALDVVAADLGVEVHLRPDDADIL